MLELFYGTPNVRRVTRRLAALKFVQRKWYRLWEEVARRADKSRNDETTVEQSTVRGNSTGVCVCVCVCVLRQLLIVLSISVNYP